MNSLETTELRSDVELSDSVLTVSSVSECLVTCDSCLGSLRGKKNDAIEVCIGPLHATDFIIVSETNTARVKLRHSKTRHLENTHTAQTLLSSIAQLLTLRSNLKLRTMELY